MTAPAPPLGPAADPDVVAAAVAACPDVVALSGGTVGEVATYLPGRRVAEVRIAADAIEVHVVARYGPTVAEIADQVRRAVRRVAGSLPVTVGVDDLEVPAPGGESTAAIAE